MWWLPFLSTNSSILLFDGGKTTEPPDLMTHDINHKPLRTGHALCRSVLSSMCHLHLHLSILLHCFSLAVPLQELKKKRLHSTTGEVALWGKELTQKTRYLSADPRHPHRWSWKPLTFRIPRTASSTCISTKQNCVYTLSNDLNEAKRKEGNLRDKQREWAWEAHRSRTSEAVVYIHI